MWCLGLSPKTISTLARPRSASMISTRLPALAASTARLAVMLVLPTPPLPLVTAMTRRREPPPPPSLAAGPGPGSLGGDPLPQALCLVHEPDSLLRWGPTTRSTRKLPVAGCRSSGTRWPSVTHEIGRGTRGHRRQHAARAVGLVQLGEDQPLHAVLAVAAGGGGDLAGARGRRQHQVQLHARARRAAGPSGWRWSRRRSGRRCRSAPGRRRPGRPPPPGSVASRATCVFTPMISPYRPRCSRGTDTVGIDGYQLDP